MYSWISVSVIWRITRPTLPDSLSVCTCYQLQIIGEKSRLIRALHIPALFTGLYFRAFEWRPPRTLLVWCLTFSEEFGTAIFRLIYNLDLSGSHFSLTSTWLKWILWKWWKSYEVCLLLYYGPLKNSNKLFVNKNKNEVWCKTTKLITELSMEKIAWFWMGIVNKFDWALNRENKQCLKMFNERWFKRIISLKINHPMKKSLILHLNFEFKFKKCQFIWKNRE